MSLTRRDFALLGIAAAASGCVSDSPVTQAARSPRAQYPTANNPAFDTWLAGFRAKAAGRGISNATLNKAFRNAGYLPDVVKRDRSQIQFRRTTGEYIAIAASDARIADGKAMMRRHAGTLNALETRFGVPAHVLTAVWGLESRYGTRRGDFPVISSLATLAFDGRRRNFFESQLMAALRILRRGDVTPAKMTGSWAGAMGHTQFIPTTFESFAVDFDRDGRRDIWSDDPADALASAANYLSRSGWQQGQPWGIEVTLPSGFGGSGTKATSAWAGLGVKPARGARLPNAGNGTLVRTEGPAFLVFQNYRVFRRYNDSLKYALGVGHLSDRLNGQGPLIGQFPPDANGLTLSDRKHLQSRLKSMGYDIGDVDGVIGQKTIAAIEAFQRRRGLPVDGQPTRELLELLG